MKGIWKYKDLMPPVNESHQIALGEGDTPLIKSKHIGKLWGLDHLYFKLENNNPTGSYKDRFAAMAVARALQDGKKAILATSSGNTGAALAAYSAAAGLPCIVALVDGAPFGKTQQMGVYGAELLMINQFGINDDCTLQVMKELKNLSDRYNCALEISAYKFSPLGMQGVQTIAFEIASELPGVNQVFVPAGGGGLYLSIVLGFSKWQQHINDQVQPIITCVQPEGNDTIASVLRGTQTSPTALINSTTTISGLQVSSLLDAQQIIEQAPQKTRNGQLVSDEQVFELQKLLAQKEGIYCEPAGAVSLAGLKKAIDQGNIDPKENIVCLITGNGFKDQSALNRIYTEQDCLYISAVGNFKEEIIKKINKE